jgi:hypothetical protein
MSDIFLFLIVPMILANVFAFACFAVGGGDDS